MKVPVHIAHMGSAQGTPISALRFEAPPCPILALFGAGGIGKLFQDALPFAPMTVARNLLFALPHDLCTQRPAPVQQALKKGSPPGYCERDLATPSGVQRAWVTHMRDLLAQPRTLLLHEPFSKLDAALRDQFCAFVFEHIRARRIPAARVTQDAADTADSALVVELTHAG